MSSRWRRVTISCLARRSHLACMSSLSTQISVRKTRQNKFSLISWLRVSKMEQLSYVPSLLLTNSDLILITFLLILLNLRNGRMSGRQLESTPLIWLMANLRISRSKRFFLLLTNQTILEKWHLCALKRLKMISQLVVYRKTMANRTYQLNSCFKDPRAIPNSELSWFYKSNQSSTSHNFGVSSNLLSQRLMPKLF